MAKTVYNLNADSSSQTCLVTFLIFFPFYFSPMPFLLQVSFLLYSPMSLSTFCCPFLHSILLFSCSTLFWSSCQPFLFCHLLLSNHTSLFFNTILLYFLATCTSVVLLSDFQSSLFSISLPFPSKLLSLPLYIAFPFLVHTSQLS
ncbi:hypothetical protein XELAEV_18034944mg [Xenopus laevis]|uniref:Uncharacterized protein n=1 Tax=Xenopus laevis TaxID=8355 RepID=A0A974CGZ6_XENLA|nr:hypothetical protein XELAEV_18034944mg [Xenopus laevis]